MHPERQPSHPDPLSRCPAELLQRLADGIAAIQDSETFRRYLQVQARFHRYSFNNVLLIMSQRPTATRVASYATWQELGRQVSRGERGIKILYPMLKKYRCEDAETGEPQLGERRVGFGVGNVFDVAQTSGPPLPERSLPELESHAGLGLLVDLYQVAADEGLRVDNLPQAVLSSGEAGYYVRSRRYIAVREAAPLQMTVTLAHELAHHFGGDDQSYTMRTRPHEETMAESVAYIACAHYGLDTSEASFAYVAFWAKEKRILREALGKIQRVSARLIDRVEQGRHGVAAPGAAVHKNGAEFQRLDGDENAEHCMGTGGR
jgi:antirestriction protein ArdC